MPPVRIVRDNVSLIEVVHDLGDRTGKPIAQAAADSVEHDDFIVNRITGDGQDRGHHDQGKLAAAQSENSESDDQVMGQRGEGADGERSSEPHAHINEDPDQTESESESALARQFFADQRADMVGLFEFQAGVGKRFLQPRPDLVRVFRHRIGC